VPIVVVAIAGDEAVDPAGEAIELECRRFGTGAAFLPRLHYNGAIWAIAHRLGRLAWKILHDGVTYIEQGQESNPVARKRRARKMALSLRKLGYAVTLTPIPEPGRG
jgi:hypothetical protein